MGRAVRTGTIALLAVMASAHSPAGQEFFGDFLDRLRGTFVTQAPRPVFKLEQPFRFRDPNGMLWSAPAGVEVDGASIPQAFWSIIGGPFEGAYINASVIHDHYCTTRARTAHDTHRNFYYGMRASGVSKWQAKLMHWAVSLFGPSWTITNRVIMQQDCRPRPDRSIECNSAPRMEREVTEQQVDLGDPMILSAALLKTHAVARTLYTSDGEVLDVTNAGAVPATLDQIERSADAYRQVFLSRELTSSPNRLGLLSQTGDKGLADIQAWPNRRIPNLRDAIVLTPQTIPAIERSAPFKLDPRSVDLIQGRLDLKSLASTTQIKGG